MIYNGDKFIMKKIKIIDKKTLSTIQGGRSILNYLDGYTIGQAIKKALHR